MISNESEFFLMGKLGRYIAYPTRDKFLEVGIVNFASMCYLISIH